MLLTIISILIRLVFAFVGKAGPIVIDAVEKAQKGGYEGAAARDRVIRQVKNRLPEIGEWFLNWLIENALGLEAIKGAKLLKKLKLPGKLKPNW